MESTTSNSLDFAACTSLRRAEEHARDIRMRRYRYSERDRTTRCSGPHTPLRSKRERRWGLPENFLEGRESGEITISSVSVTTCAPTVPGNRTLTEYAIAIWE